ncbi:MAG: TlpA family protein disulfide reductase [Acidimicrobiia bacterium]
MEPTPTDIRSSRRLLHILGLVVVAASVLFWLISIDPSSDSSLGFSSGRGDPAPDFTLTLFDGTRFSLSQHLETDGRPVVLNFWASWCGPCREEMPAFDVVARRRPDVLFVGVAIRDSEPEARAFAAETGVGYPLGIDSSGEILERYPILGLPTTWFITSDGRIAASWAGQLNEKELERLIDQQAKG